MKIFVIEDDKTLKRELMELLNKYGYETETSDNYQNIIEDIIENKTDLIILDINLPYYDGFYICRELRKKTETPIIIVTSRNNDMDEIVITNGSDGSRIIVESDEIKIEAVEVDNIMDATGCGDTYMAAYILKRLLLDSPKEAGEFASLIASEKLMSFGPYKSLI